MTEACLPSDRRPGAVEAVAWVLDGAPEAAMLTDTAGVIRYVNPAFEAMTGFSRADVLGRTPALLKSGVQPPDFYRRLWRTLGAGHEFRAVFVNRRKDGRLFHQEQCVRPLFDAGGRVTHYLASGRDVSEHVATFERLTRAATHDGLTGLPNRALFVDRLHHRVQCARREGDRFALVLVDVNDFKAVNDTWGHVAGDTVLRQVALRLLHAVREADTVARLGGDEFGLLLAGTPDEGACESALRKIVDAFQVPMPLGARHSLLVSVSAGACLPGPDEHDEQRLLEAADAAMYRAKRRAGGGYEIGRTDDDALPAPDPPPRGLPRRHGRGMAGG